MDQLTKISRTLNRLMVGAAGFFLVAMVVLTCANIVFRITWVPIRGTFELMGYFGAVVTAFAMGYTQIKRGHIAVDVLIDRFSARTQRLLHMINASVCLVFFVLVTWQTVVKANILRTSGEVTETLRIIYYPFTYAVAAGCGFLCLVLLVELMAALTRQKGGAD